MTFTDDDLKRLKNWGCIPTNQWTLEMDEEFHRFCAEKMIALLARLEAHEQMADYIAHDDYCIRTRNEAGEPLPNGSYRVKYDGKWYQYSPIDETPKCNCGLDEKWYAWCKAAGKNG